MVNKNVFFEWVMINRVDYQCCFLDNFNLHVQSFDSNKIDNSMIYYVGIWDKINKKEIILDRVTNMEAGKKLCENYVLNHKY